MLAPVHRRLPCPSCAAGTLLWHPQRADSTPWQCSACGTELSALPQQLQQAEDGVEEQVLDLMVQVKDGVQGLAAGTQPSLQRAAMQAQATGRMLQLYQLAEKELGRAHWTVHRVGLILAGAANKATCRRTHAQLPRPCASMLFGLMCSLGHLVHMTQHTVWFSLLYRVHKLNQHACVHADAHMCLLTQLEPGPTGMDHINAIKVGCNWHNQVKSITVSGMVYDNSRVGLQRPSQCGDQNRAKSMMTLLACKTKVAITS